MAKRNKIVSIDDLAKIVAEQKKKGKKVAHCHGCFDLLHLGHIKHFESAAKAADVLIVTLTQDKFVNKGPGRPVFNEQQRAEAIASLESVDYVAINHWPTAIETLKKIKPDFYVKGPDYKDQTKDLTGNIALEEKAVIEGGGKIYITDDVVFSSSNLLNAHFSKHSDKVQEFLQTFRKKHKPEQVLKYVEDLSKLKILVIGDTIIDEYHYCSPLGKSSKSPTISSKYLRGDAYAGGVLAIANHLEQFAGKVEMISCLGSENTQKDIVSKKVSSAIESKFFVRQDGPTPTKRRYLDVYLNIKLFEVTFMNDKHIDEKLEKEIIQYLEKRLKHVDMVMVADFGHGLITPGIIKFLERSGKYLAVNAQTNSNNYGFNYITKYHRADYISIDEKELRLPFGDNYGKLEDLIFQLQKISKAKKIQITLGQQGSIWLENKKFTRVPAFATSVKDSVGAGDAVLSLTSLCAYNNVPAEVTSFIGNCTGSLAVEIIGNEHPVYKKDLLKYINHFLK